MKDIRQLKLINGEEIICEVVDESFEQYSGEFDMHVKSCMALQLKVVDMDPDEEPYRYYSLNPWMVYGEDAENPTFLKSEMIVAECQPSPLLLDQYIVGIKQMGEVYDSKIMAREKFKQDLETVKEQLKNLKRKNLLQLKRKKNVH
jgi:hypothetical protein